MSIHVCECIHNGKVEYHLRYPGMTKQAAQELASKINSGAITVEKPVRQGPWQCLMCANAGKKSMNFPERTTCFACGSAHHHETWTNEV